MKERMLHAKWNPRHKEWSIFHQNRRVASGRTPLEAFAVYVLDHYQEYQLGVTIAAKKGVRQS